MISDVLSDAISEIDRYLSDPAWKDFYQGETLVRIRALRVHMDEIRRRLDTPPDSQSATKAMA